MRTLIIDDESDFREILRYQLQQHCPALSIVGEADGVSSGVKAIQSHQPELVFLDIDMPPGNGFDVLKQLQPLTFDVIFSTSHNEYAIQAFKFCALDYLLKPINKVELVNAVNKALQRQQKQQQHYHLEMLMSNLAQQDHDKKISLPTSGGLLFVPLPEIVRFEAEGRYTWCYRSTGEKHLITKTLKEYEEMLMGYQFLRIHKSHFIHLKHVVEYSRLDGGSVNMSDGSELQISRDKKVLFLSEMGKLF